MSTSGIVFNKHYKQMGLPEYYYRSSQPQPSNRKGSQQDSASLFTSNMGSFVSYAPGVCWNQMSDRIVPSVQKAVVPTGINSSSNRRHSSVTSSRPGCQAPGGIGCDIKHNSYDRYLNRLKGKKIHCTRCG
jgi:hypothetical protein